MFSWDLSIRTLITVLLIVTPYYAHASLYTVELLVFKYLHPQSSSEQFTFIPQYLPSRTSSIELMTAPEPHHQAYYAFPKKQQQLKYMANRMRRHRDYRLMWHAKWQQPLSLKYQTLAPLAIIGGDPLTLYPQRQAPIFPLPATHRKTEPSFYTFLPPPPLSPEVELHGTLQLRKNRYIHSDLTLVYQEDHVYFKAYHLHKDIKVTLGELHYLDHPKFGALLLISKSPS